MNSFFVTTEENWAALEYTLRIRRNLESSLRPVEILGIKASPKSWQSYEDFQKELKQKRQNLKKENKRLWENLALKNKVAVKKKIEELKKIEIELWAKCRPDLYPLETAI
jgi:hypothetical protein